MTETAATIQLTSALEDYLETIYELVRTNKLARVKDIASARGVRSASVTPAMKRLSDMGLVRYEQREFIDLTPEGEAAARRILSRHQLLTRFFTQFLEMSPNQAEKDACSMEHSLSPEGMSKMVRLFEFLDNCPDGQTFLDQFHTCPLVQEERTECPDSCAHLGDRADLEDRGVKTMSLDSLASGEEGKVLQVGGQGAVRQRILDMGILPGVRVRMERRAPTGDPIWIRVQGFQLSLRLREAESIQLVVEA